MKQYIYIILLFFGNINARPLKVLFVTDKFPYEPRQFINNQITGFIDAGVDVTILADCIRTQADFPEVEQYHLLEKTYYKKLPEHLKSFDIIYCQLGDVFDLYKDIRDGCIKGKLVVCFIGGDATGRFVKNPDCYKQMFSKIDLALPVCQSFADNLIKHGCPKERVLVHKSGIDCERFIFKPRVFPKDGLIRIISVGRLCKMKGQEFAIQAIALLKKYYPKIRYDIVGFALKNKSKYVEKLVKLIEDLELQDTVFLNGHLPHKEVVKVLDKAHIFLLTSNTPKSGNTEGIPNVIMEAFATGLPVLATRHGGIGELVEHKVSGILVNEYDVQAIADGLFYLIKHPERWKEMALHGNEKVKQNHDKNKLNNFIIKKFEEMAEIKRSNHFD